jgi:hypothetical protein
MPAPSFDMCCHVEKLSQDVLELEPRQDVRSEQLMKLDMKQRYVDDGQEREARGRCLRGISTCHRELFPKVKKNRRGGEARQARSRRRWRRRRGRIGWQVVGLGPARWPPASDLSVLDLDRPAPSHARRCRCGCPARLVVVSSNFSSSSTTLVVYSTLARQCVVSRR